MPKTARDLWPSVINFENLFKAWQATRLGKRYEKESLLFGERLEENLFELQGRLLHKTWMPSRWREFVVREPKLRLVQAPPFHDRVAHHALVRVIEPLFERRFIQDSYACRKGRGTLAASGRTQSFLRGARRKWPRPYVLKADIKGYFPHIRHDILMGILNKVIGDADVIWLCGQMVMQNGFHELGLPIGALTSQLFANAYLDSFDHYMKDELGVRYYLRYMDDFVTVVDGKAEARRLMELAGEFLARRLGLFLNPKTSIFPADHGVDFVGYRHWTDRILPRKRNVKRARHLFKSMARSYREGKIDLDYVRARVMSFLGYMSHCQGYKTTTELLASTVFTRGNESVMADVVGSMHDMEAREAGGMLLFYEQRDKKMGGN